MKKLFRTTLLLLIFIALINTAPLYAFTREKMPQRYVPKLHQSISFLGLGTVELGRDWGIHPKKSFHPNEQRSKMILQQALANGFQVIDSASSYQLSEERIGKYIPQAQFHYLLITKPGEHSMTAQDKRCKIPNHDNIYCHQPASVFDFNREAIFKDIEESLKKLHVRQIDVALLHLDQSHAQEILAKGEALQALADLKKIGKVKFIGVSVNGPAAIQAIQTDKMDVIELEYNLLNQTNKKAIDLAHEKGIGVIVRGGLGTGLLTPYVAKRIYDPDLPYGPQIRALLKLVNGDYKKLIALSLQFLYADENISSVILGIDDPKFFKKDLKLMVCSRNRELLNQALKVLATFDTPDSFTEQMGEYYQ